MTPQERLDAAWLEFAKSAGLPPDSWPSQALYTVWLSTISAAIEETRAEMAREHLVEHDRALSAGIEAAKEEEREACAEIAEVWINPKNVIKNEMEMVAQKIARKIRARSTAVAR